jgi:hypothetical protein
LLLHAKETAHSYCAVSFLSCHRHSKPKSPTLLLLLLLLLLCGTWLLNAGHNVAVSWLICIYAMPSIHTRWHSCSCSWEVLQLQFSLVNCKVPQATN